MDPGFLIASSAVLLLFTFATGQAHVAWWLEAIRDLVRGVALVTAIVALASAVWIALV